MSHNNKELNLLIESLVEQELGLGEVAVSSNQIANEQLALLNMAYDAGDILLILYSPNYIAEKLQKQPNPDDWYDDDYDKVVIGGIRINKNTECGKGVWTVSYSVASKGYGPFMYDAAFSAISPDLLTADRSQTSEAARKVWKYIAVNRAKEFKRKKLGPNCAFEDWDELGQEDYLNYAYTPKSKINISGLETAHGQFYMKLPNAIRAKVVTKIRTYGIKLFQKKYGGLG